MTKDRKYFFCKNCDDKTDIHNICYDYTTKQELCHDCFFLIWGGKTT